MTLSAAGAAVVKRWFDAASPAKETLTPSPAEEALAGRLVEAGMAHPLPAVSTGPVHVVIPFHGDHRDLAATVAGVRSQRPASITVVDDGNPSPPSLPTDVVIVRHGTSGGPAAARNTGWRRLVADGLIADRSAVDDAAPDDTDDVIVFIDAGVTTGADDLQRLAGHLGDESVGAAAPRVATEPGPALIDRYEAHFSPLDLGPDPSPVGLGRRVTYVPTACLAVRASQVVDLDGFDDQLRFGEDVDFIWRLVDRASVRYDPSVIVRHGARVGLRAFARQRVQYASAAAPLAARHADAVHPWRSNLLGAAGVALASLGHPFVALGVGLLPVGDLRDKLDTTVTPTATAIRLLAIGHGWSLRSFAETAARSWIVFALPLAVRSRVARRWIVAGWARRALTTTDPALLALGVIDDVAYGTGVGLGAWRQRSIRALVPAITRRWN